MAMGFLQNIDYEIVRAATNLGGQSALRDQIVYGLAHILPYVFVLAGLFIFSRGRTKLQKERNQEVVLIGLAAVLLAIGVRWLLSEVINRPRPFETYEHLHYVIGGGALGSSSFPSQHAMLLFAFAGTVYFIGHHPHWGRLLLFLAAVVAVARVVAGVHFASDVLGGAALGLGIAKLLSWQSRWVHTQLKE